MISRKNAFPKPVLDRKYSVDGLEITFRDFLKKNFYGGAKDISTNQVRDVVELEINECIFIQNVEVKRLS